MATQSTQNLTVRLSQATIGKAKRLAAERDSSVSRLVAELIERLVGEADAYDAARRRALAQMAHGYALGGRIRANREDWHER